MVTFGAAATGKTNALKMQKNVNTLRAWREANDRVHLVFLELNNGTPFVLSIYFTLQVSCPEIVTRNNSAKTLCTAIENKDGVR